MQNTFISEDTKDQVVHEKYILYVDYTETILNSNGEELVQFARQALINELGDEVDVDTVKVKRPRLVVRSLDKMLKRTPQAKIKVVTRF